MKPLAAIVVVNYRSSGLLRSVLGGVNLDPDEFVVIVVDNFSDQEERSAVKSLAYERGWELLALASNLGFGAAANAGARLALQRDAAVVLFVNPDAQVTASLLSELRTQVLAAPGSVVTPEISSPARRTLYQGSVLELGSGRIRKAAPRAANVAEWLPATCLALSSHVLQRVGGFDDRYFMYWEDVDFTIRARAAGFDLVVRDDLVVVHDSGGTQTAVVGRAKSPLYYRYNCRNRLVFAACHLERELLARWILRTPVESWRILMQGGRRQLISSPGTLVAAVAGTVAGLRLAVRALGRPAAGPGESVTLDIPQPVVEARRGR